MTMLREELIKIGAKVVQHSKCPWWRNCVERARLSSLFLAKWALVALVDLLPSHRYDLLGVESDQQSLGRALA